MKILITTSIFSPETRGPAIYTGELVRQLGRQDDRLSVVTFTQNPTEIKNVEITSISQSGGTIIRQARLFLSILRNSSDLIYAQGADVVGFASVLAGKILHKPVVIKFVGDLSVEMERDFGKNTEYLFWVTKIVLILADKIIFPAKHLQENIIKKYKISKNKTEVIYNAIN